MSVGCARANKCLGGKTREKLVKNSAKSKLGLSVLCKIETIPLCFHVERVRDKY